MTLLGNARNPRKCVPHLNKMFAGIDSLCFNSPDSPNNPNNPDNPDNPNNPDNPDNPGGDTEQSYQSEGSEFKCDEKYPDSPPLDTVITGVISLEGERVLLTQGNTYNPNNLTNPYKGLNLVKPSLSLSLFRSFSLYVYMYVCMYMCMYYIYI